VRHIKLTEEQAKIVEDNIALTYWYLGLKGLDPEEWWDLLAIELCKSVIHHNPKKGSLANYFKMRSDFLVIKQNQKNKAQKRTNNGMYDLDDEFTNDQELIQLSYDYNEDILESIMLQDLLDGEYGDIIRLKYMGYTQSEISEYLGVSQSQISKILKKVRDDLDKETVI
jgi:RNA polymerase sigma factor (sigma-70 family)